MPPFLVRIVLIYHPIHDVNHATYRLLRILEASEHSSFSWEQIRLFDFYSLFPQSLKDIKPFPRELSAYKKIVQRIPDAYEAMPNENRIMFQLMPIQNTAIHNLLAKELLSETDYQKGLISRSGKPLPSGLLETIKSDPATQEDWFRFIVDELPTISFEGKRGLKFRSDLLEYRYDG